MPADEDDGEDGYAQRERRFRQLYEEHYRSVQAYAVRRVDSGTDVADTVAEVFTTAWRRLADIPPPPADRLWLYGVARRVLAGQHRSSRRFRRLIARIEAAHGGASELAGASGTPVAPVAPGLWPDSPNDPLMLALRRLRAAEREALMLVTWEELSHAEAARVLGCSANAVAIRVHRAKARLREALAPATGTAAAAAAAADVADAADAVRPGNAVPFNSYGR